ncbi:IS110 family transposase, partial [Paenarthrobacter sp. NPDC057981]|uniref:IS110 family transposase n=1 Tax=Paenarthrobacter sp. NPDC057981 TaxID=3346297 RepID=UPI0036D926F9
PYDERCLLRQPQHHKEGALIMKFKQSVKQNQRIERITSHHLIIGIDIAKFKHVARATDYRGIERGSYLVFSNDLEGYEKLYQWMQALMLQFNKTNVIFGVEPTGHYWFNLAFWLKEKLLELVLVNPFQVKRNKENRDNSPTKNDVKDALVIADMVKNGYYSETHIHAEPYRALRQLVGTRDFVTKQVSSVVNQMYRWTDMYFPEFQQVFKDITSKTALATLAEFAHPSDLRHLTVEDVIAGWRKRLKRAGSRKVSAALIHAAQRTAAIPNCVEEAKLSISLLLQQLQMYNDQLNQLEEKMSQLLRSIPTAKLLRTIKGMNDITLATLYSEAGDLGGFTHGNQVLRLAGLHLSENSSGTYKGEVKITKRGRPGLRKLLFMTVFHMVSINPEFRALHQYNKQVKNMKGMKSIMKLCGKLARMLVAMAKKHSVYDINKVTVAA